MATISLRAYIREIESLIDHNQTDAAIAHCMHILQFMPKHIGTYRMLGKALHEAQRYADAADVFQRVLTVAPDDFVANVGLSIIRQDEGNMDAAIWHMERAYETQPSNLPIQEELRRLHGRRDGLEPPRVRLTRGALARMYMKGHLYHQAIGELRAALAEDPNRADLQVLLAQAAYLTGQKVDAVEVCSQLLKKYPYCLEANRLLALILPNTERAKDTEIYRQRVIALDPYLQKADPGSMTSDGIPDSAIMLEKLEILAGEGSTAGESQPDWAASLGEPFKTPEQTELPEWLREEQHTERGLEAGDLAQESQASGPSDISWETSTGKLGTDWLKRYEGTEADALEAEEPSQEPAIPDWMKAAGWEPSEGGDLEAPVSWEEFEAASGDEIEQGDVPDWLKAIAPGDTAPTEGEVPTWLQATTPGATDTIRTWLNETQGATPEEDLSDLESALDQVIAEKAPGDADSSEEVPEWLSGLETKGPSEGPTTGELQLPDWLREAEPEQAVAAEESAGAGMEWLKEIEATEVGDSMQTLIAMPPAEEFAAEDLVSEKPESLEEPVEAEPAYETPDWLKEMAETEQAEPTLEIAGEEFTTAKAEAEEELADMKSMEAEVQIPDWLKPEILTETVAESGAEETILQQPEILAEAVEAESADEVPDWLKAMVEETEEGTGGEPGDDATLIIPRGTVEETLITEPVVEEPALPEPDGVEATIVTELDLEEEVIAPEPAEGGETLIAELAIEEQMTAPEITQIEETIISEPVSVEETIIAEPIAGTEPLSTEVPASAEFGLLNEDDALAFLASLAAKHEGEAGWLESVVSETMGEDASVLGMEQVKTPDLPVEEVLPTSEQALEITEEAPLVEGEAETFAWLEAIAETEETKETQPGIPEQESSLEPPAWVTAGVIPEEETAQGIPSSDEIPDWLQTPSEEELGETLPTFKAAEEALPPATLEKIDLNRASLAELEDLPGVGFIMAQNIINYRQSHGSIRQIADLTEIPGITQADTDWLSEFVEIPAEAPQASVVTRRLNEPESEIDEVLLDARQSVAEHDLGGAAKQYPSLTQEDRALPEIIQDLREALAQNPRDLNLWQALGDACMRNDQLQEALEAYSQAEELLR